MELGEQQARIEAADPQAQVEKLKAQLKLDPSFIPPPPKYIDEVVDEEAMMESESEVEPEARSLPLDRILGNKKPE